MRHSWFFEREVRENLSLSNNNYRRFGEVYRLLLEGQMGSSRSKKSSEILTTDPASCLMYSSSELGRTRIETKPVERLPLQWFLSQSLRAIARFRRANVSCLMLVSSFSLPESAPTGQIFTKIYI